MYDTSWTSKRMFKTKQGSYNTTIADNRSKCSGFYYAISSIWFIEKKIEKSNYKIEYLFIW